MLNKIVPIFVLFNLLACGDESSSVSDASLDTNGDSGQVTRTNQIWVANRATNDLSIIDDATLAVKRVDLPDAGEPMYANYAPLW